MKQTPRPIESHTLPGMETAVTEQTAAAGEYLGEQLAAFMLTPIEPKPTGRAATPEEMEKKAPLFFGTTYSKLF